MDGEARVVGALLDAPFGPVWVVASPSGLVRIDLRPDEHVAREFLDTADERAHRVLAQALEELTAYFTAERKQFSVPVDWDGAGVTPFQRQVLVETSYIPWGQVVTYGALARAVGRPKGARAVGRALAHNPIPIVIPCHRVIAATGALQGFGGGLDIKAFLLRHEGVL